MSGCWRICTAPTARFVNEIEVRDATSLEEGDIMRVGRVEMRLMQLTSDDEPVGRRSMSASYLCL